MRFHTEMPYLAKSPSMSQSNCRRTFLAATLIAICGPRSVADTFSIEKRVCPICSTNYETAVTNSATVLGSRLDMRPIGGVKSPPRIGVCTKCGFVDYRHGEKYPKEELAITKAYVESDEFRKLAKDETPYYRAAQTYRKLNRSPEEVATFLLYSVWEAEDKNDKSLLFRHLSECMAAAEQVSKDNTVADGTRETFGILKGELLRRMGKFEEAEAHFATLAGDAAYSMAPFPELIRQERDLVRRKDDAPHPFERK